MLIAVRARKAVIGFPVDLRDEGVSPQAKRNEKMRKFPTYTQGFHCEFHVHEIKVSKQSLCSRDRRTLLT